MSNILPTSGAMKKETVLIEGAVSSMEGVEFSLSLRPPPFVSEKT